MKEFLESVINTGNYRLSDMENRIKKLFATGDLTEEEMVYLLALAAERADDSRQIDIPTILADLEARVAALESAGVCVWVPGMVTMRGQTVLYDILKEGILRYLRYDGGRESTSLSPGKINGWVVLSAAGGVVTHTVERDENGNIILVPVEPENNAE